MASADVRMQRGLVTSSGSHGQSHQRGGGRPRLTMTMAMIYDYDYGYGFVTPPGSHSQSHSQPRPLPGSEVAGGRGVASPRRWPWIWCPSPFTTSSSTLPGDPPRRQNNTRSEGRGFRSYRLCNIQLLKAGQPPNPGGWPA